MKKRYTRTEFVKILVPIVWECASSDAIAAARAISNEGRVVFVGLVSIPQGESLSTAAMTVRQVRRILQELQDREGVQVLERVRVTHQPWRELVRTVQEEEPDLLVLEWPCHFNALQVTPAEVLLHPPCDIAVACGPLPERPQRVLVSMRGGPYAELALRLSLAVGRSSQAGITALHLVPAASADVQDAPFRGIDKVLAHLPQVERRVLPTDDPADVILDVSQHYDLVVMGATAQPAHLPNAIGPVAERIMKESPAGVIVVKTSRPMPADLASEAVGQTAISVLVDKWFAENTFHAEEFSDLEHLLSLKRKQGLSISLALPALNEQETVGEVIDTVKSALMDKLSLLDEIVLVDSDSTDRTREIASSLGVPVHIHQQVLSGYGPRTGKGEALWKSLYLTSGDIVVWIDTDIVNIHPRFVYGLLGPLLLRPEVQFVKGFYRRPLKVGDKVQAGGGGRVTELTARPLLNLFYPELSGLVQPLAGEYGGRRSALEQLPFFSGYGVEIGLLIEVFDRFGLSAIAQVDLQERVHHNQPLESLSKMSFAIIQAVIRKLERRYGQDFLEEVNKTMKLIRYEPGRFFLDIEEIAERERPPIIELSEYRELRRL